MKNFVISKAVGHMRSRLIVALIVCAEILFGFSATAQTETAPQPQEQNANDSLINLLHDNNPNINGGTPNPWLSDDEHKKTKLKQVRFYPNPTNGTLQIDSGENPINNWKVFDLQGRVVLQGQKNNTIDMGSLSSGTYVVQVLLENGEQGQELILKK